MKVYFKGGAAPLDPPLLRRALAAPAVVRDSGALSAWVQWVRSNPPILREGFSKPSNFDEFNKNSYSDTGGY